MRRQDNPEDDNGNSDLQVEYEPEITRQPDRDGGGCRQPAIREDVFQTSPTRSIVTASLFSGEEGSHPAKDGRGLGKGNLKIDR